MKVNGSTKMRIIRNLIIGAFILSCATFLSINSQTINLRIFPTEFKMPNDIVSLPAYAIMLVSTGIGLLLGTFLEYSRARRDRRMSKRRLREVEKLYDKVKYLTNEKTSDTDEILGLLK